MKDLPAQCILKLLDLIIEEANGGHQAAKTPLKVWSDESPDPKFEVHQHPINRNRKRHRGKNDDTIKGLPFIDVPTDPPLGRALSSDEIPLLPLRNKMVTRIEEPVTDGRGGLVIKPPPKRWQVGRDGSRGDA